MKNAVFWDVTPYSLVQMYRPFEAVYCPHLQHRNEKEVCCETRDDVNKTAVSSDRRNYFANKSILHFPTWDHLRRISKFLLHQRLGFPISCSLQTPTRNIGVHLSSLTYFVFPRQFQPLFIFFA